MKKVLIIGAGPAGLTAGYELLARGGGSEYEVTILEEDNVFGGISRTVNYKGNRMDMGGHRFFTKVPAVNDWWEKMLPMQGAPAWDDLQLNREINISSYGPDPEIQDNVMLKRHRVSRIFFDNKFYDYPITLKKETFENMGIKSTILVGMSYLKALVLKKKETNLENFYINRFGKKLYSMFFEYYTENLWGRHPREIDASWGKQRVKGLSIIAVLKDVFQKKGKAPNKKTETSLIEEFKYPKLGPGQLWNVTAKKILEMGGTIIKNAKVIGICKNEESSITSLIYEKMGVKNKIEGDYIISSMPIRDLISGMNDVPDHIRRIANGLPYRDYMTLGVLVSELKLKNKTSMKTVSNIIPDCWVYVQDRRVKMGRFQVYNNWSPYMVKDAEHTVWIGLEYFVNEGDSMWNMTEEQFSEYAIKEMVQIGLIDNADKVLDTHMEKVKKAYPAYFDTYNEMNQIVDYLSSIENLFCVGRNGQHRYNNIDHSMCTSFEAVKNIILGEKDKQNIWSVNTEQEYHEK